MSHADIFCNPCKGCTKQYQFERITTRRKLIYIEQYVEDLTEYASCLPYYGYNLRRLLGKCGQYPDYGASETTFTMKINSKWQNNIQEYAPQDADPFGAAYYITLSFKEAVVPQDHYIFETLNPGSVVRVLGRLDASDWKLMWERPPQICPEQSRKFHPPIRDLSSSINIIRLEFNKDHLEEHRTSIDAVLLKGYQLPRCLLQLKNIFQSLFKFLAIKSSSRRHIGESPDLFSRLPDTTVLLIFQYLDLKSLSRCAQVNKAWNKIAQNPILYRNLSLKRYWYKVDGKTLDYFKDRCKQLKKLDLAWCSCTEVDGFLEGYNRLTHLSLYGVPFIEPQTLQTISNCGELTELRLTCSTTFNFECLAKLNKLVTLDLSYTTISYMPLLQILKANPNLRHIILDRCNSLSPMIWLTAPVSTYNKNLVVWSSPGVPFARSRCGGIEFREPDFSTYDSLEVLELGGCFYDQIHPGNFLQKVAVHCTNLQRLGISLWLHLDDEALLPVIHHCKDLTHLDLSQNERITSNICDKALMSLPNLKLLNVSYCPSISDERVRTWRRDYPNVEIQ